MCCYEDQNVIDECKAMFDENGEAVFYKVVRMRVLSTPRGIESLNGNHIWESGINEAIREGVKYNSSNPVGFHVCLTKKDAENIDAYYRYTTTKIIKVVCKKEHLITAGYAIADFTCVGKQAVFSQATITQQEWDENVESHLSREKIYQNEEICS